MGVHHLLSKLRKRNCTSNEIAFDERLHNKWIGVDFMVVGHKSVGSVDGAGEMAVRPEIPNSVMVEKCTRLCGWAKKNNITWVVSVDGMYHSMKGSVNNNRKKDRKEAMSKFAALIAEYKGKDVPKEKMKEVKKLLKKAYAYVSDKIVSVGVKVLRDHGHEVYGACFESDFQLVY